MPIRDLLIVPAALTLAVAGAAPAAAQAPEHSISVNPLTAKPLETFTVTGSSECPTSGYTVTLSYIHAADGPATVTVSGTTNAEGAYTQEVAVPEHAVEDDPAEITSVIAECGEGGAAESNDVAVGIGAHEGNLSVSPTQGEPGNTVTISGTNCWGDEVTAGFGDGESFDYSVVVEDVTVAEDRTITGTFTIPDGIEPGDYVFFADCPGSEFPFADFEVLAGEDTDGSGPPPVDTPPPAAPPAEPMPGTPTFTG